MEAISEFLANTFSGNAFFATFIISFIPLIELTGAIPFGMSGELWGAAALSAANAFWASVLGGAFITLALALVFDPIYNKLKDKRVFKSIINFFTQSASKKSQQICKTNNNSNWKKFFIVFAFVAIPVPGTGVYTGTILAVFMGLNFIQTILSVTLGNVVAGLIIMFVCSIFPQFTTIILFVFIGIVVAYLAYRIFVMVLSKKSNEKSKEE